MESRKIQLVGNRSYSVSLPKRWVKEKGLKEQDIIFIDEMEGNLIITAKGEEKNQPQSEGSFNLDTIKHIEEFIVFSYLKNVDRIRLTSKQIDYNRSIQIHNVIKFLDGYEITHEDKNSIEITFLFKDLNITLKRIMRRMVFLLHTGLTSICNQDMDSVDDNETTIDRLYHMAKRLIFACMDSESMRQQNNINHKEDLFFYMSIVKKLENVGDALNMMRGSSFSKKDMEAMQTVLNFLEEVLTSSDIERLKNMLEEAQKRIKGSENEFFLMRMHGLCEDILENVLSISFNNTYFR